jgi:hypothetical protein
LKALGNPICQGSLEKEKELPIPNSDRQDQRQSIKQLNYDLNYFKSNSNRQTTKRNKSVFLKLQLKYKKYPTYA